MGILLELDKIRKEYPGTVANDDISLEVQYGEVYALLGENGAGKSTLMNILYGLAQPDHGKIQIDGKEVKVHSPKDAIAHGIGMVHQHFMLIPALTVVENIILAMTDYKHVFLDKKAVAKRIKELSNKYSLEIDPFKKVSELTVGQQQRVEIIKALYSDCKLLILDEPTAVLTPQEIEELFVIINQFKSENKSVIFITHKLNEVMRVSDRISVLRAGRNVASLLTKDTDPQSLAALMVGKPVTFVVEKEKIKPGKTVLEVENLQVKDKTGHITVDGLNLSVREGEIYGIAGVDGNGQSELIKGITALVKKQGGKVIIGEEDVTKATAGQVLSCGVSHIPEDRQNVGVVMDMSITKNLMFYDYKNQEYKNGIFLNWKKINEHVLNVIEKYNVKTPSEKILMSSLSGGNQQKAVVARELEKNPKLLLAVHPTRGVDIGAIEFIHKQIVDARNKGCAVLLVSTELDEVMSLSDRIGVIYEGKILGEMNREDATVEEIGMLMAGHKQEA